MPGACIYVCVFVGCQSLTSLRVETIKVEGCVTAVSLALEVFFTAAVTPIYNYCVTQI